MQLDYPDILRPVNLTLTEGKSTGDTYECDGATEEDEGFNNEIIIELEYPNNGATGFEIFRSSATDTSRIGVVLGNQRIFKDSLPPFEQEIVYSVRTFIEKGAEVFYSRKRKATITPSRLAYPTNRTIENLAGNKIIQFKYPFKGANQVKIYRLPLMPTEGRLLIGTVLLAPQPTNEIYEFIDKSGISGKHYDYYLIAEGAGGSSDMLGGHLCGATYPEREVPTNVVASEDETSYIKITWDYPTTAAVDNFLIQRKEVGAGSFSNLKSVFGQERFYFDLSIEEGTEYEYRVVAKIGDIEVGAANTSTGDPNIDSGKTIAFSNVAFKSSIGAKDIVLEGNNLLLGQPKSTTSSSDSRIRHYKYTDNEGWKTNATKNSAAEDFGTSVAADFGSSKIAVGSDNNPKDSINAYKIDGDELTGYGAKGVAFYEGLGRSVGMSSNVIIAGKPESAAGRGRVQYFEYNSTTEKWVSKHLMLSAVVGGLTNYVGQFGYNLAYNGKEVMVSEPFRASEPPTIYFYEYNLGVGNGVKNKYKFNPSDDSTNDLGKYLDLDVPYAIASSNNGAHVYFKRATEDDWTERAIIEDTEGPGPFGPVAVKGELFVTTRGDEVKFYNWDTDTESWTLKATRSNVVEGSVTAIDLSNNFMAISDNETTKVIDLMGVTTNLGTTSSTTMSRITLDWEYDGIADAEGFKIYRDGEEIESSTFTTPYKYNDVDAISGVNHLYEISPYIGNRTGKKSSIVGYLEPDGQIVGSVTTAIGGSPVADVTIMATAEINGIAYNYSTTTNGEGEFEINQVYYGSDEASYTVTASFEDHEFTTLTPNNLVELSKGIKKATINFSDKTAFGIAGKVGFAATFCGLDSIAVIITHHLSNGAIPESFYTNGQGAYAGTINPGIDNLDSITVKVQNRQEISFMESDSINYDFNVLGGNDTHFTIVQSELASLERVTTVDIVENTTYPVGVKVENACGGDAISGNMMIRVRAKNGCLDITKEVANGGIINLPPINDLIITLEDVAEPTTANLIALDFLSSRPSNLNLFDYHLNYESGDSNAEFNLTYHTPPSISISPFNNYLCTTNNAEIAIIQQGKLYTNEITIKESFGSTECFITEGFIVITNPGAAIQQDTLHYDSSTGEFETYSYLGGNPNLISPFVWTMKIAYYSRAGHFLGSKNQYLVVEGETGIPGNDVIIDPTNIPHPLFILRDPPGDNSSSSISAGQSISKEFTYKGTTGLSVSAGIAGKAKLFGVGTKTELETNVATNSTIGNTFKLNVDFNQTISTSGSAGKVGESADIIVGAGIAYQYGIVQEIKVRGCIDGIPQIDRLTKFGLSPHKINTTFIQTVADIEKSIQINANAIIALEAIPESERAAKHNAALIQFTASKEGLENVLEYHRGQTRPINYLCNDTLFGQNIKDDLVFNFTIEGSRLFLDHEEFIDDWQNAFCTYKDEKINEEGELVWDDDLVTAYNTVINALRILSDPLLITNDTRVDDWHYNKSKTEKGNLVNEALATHPLANLFGKPAENLTFGGGTSLSRSMNVGYSHANSFSFNLSTDFSGKFSFGVGNETKILIGNGIVGMIQTGTEFDATVTAKSKVSLKYSSDVKASEANTTKVSYKLADNDTGDQFSVHVLQPIESNHTPSFILFGGRSSCPPEPGTILRDRPKMQIMDGAGASEEITAYNVPTNDPAVFDLKIVNSSIYEESRSVEVYLDNQTNKNGAVIRLAGQLMGSQTFFSLAANEELVLPLTIERGLTAYDHENIQLKVKPYCTDGNKKWPDSLASAVTFNVHFVNPCTPISLVTPDNNWVINGNDNQLVIGLRDYQPSNAVFEEMKLQYRRLGAGDDWDDLPTNHLNIDLSAKPLSGPCNPIPYPVSKECLGIYNQESFFPGETPTFYIVWALPEENSTYPDGEYEIRAVALCAGGDTYSNVVNGTINRSSLDLFGTPEPADGVWTAGDEISFAFNSDLDCAIIIEPTFVADYIHLIDKSADDAPLDFSISCINNKIVLVPTADMSNYDGHTLEVRIDSMMNKRGTTISQPIHWPFRVITQDLYWETADTIKLSLYKGATETKSIHIKNSTNVPVLGASLSIKDDPITNWLTMTPKDNITIAPDGQLIDFLITANQEIGVYTAGIEINGSSGQKPELVIELTILAPPPPGTFDQTAFEKEMTIITNWRFTDMAVDAMSKDIQDILSVYINGKPRAIKNIERAGGDLYVAYLTVLGNTEDEGKTINFRVWDADEGVAYAAHAEVDILFEIDKMIGNTIEPEILMVDKAIDEIKNIPMNAGWTWFSLNTQLADMSISKSLASLTKLTTGDIIKTGDKFAQYIEGQGWVAAGENPLTQLSIKEGYALYL